MTGLQEHYTKTIRPQLSQELSIKNAHALPRLEKISVNVGWGELKGNEALQKHVVETLSLITGQKPISSRAKQSIAGFKVRQNDLLGYKITLRGKRMYDFLERLITYVFPRIRDFQGLPLHGFDKQGNYTFGVREQTVFPEVPLQAADRTWGLQISLVTTAKNRDEALALLTNFGFPFEKKSETK